MVRSGSRIFKEIRIALIVGVVLSVANGIRIYVMYQDMKLAFVIGITIIAIVCMAKVVGCVLPLVAKRIGLDPALMATPLISTLLDTGTILVYFAIVTLMFRL